MKEKKDSRKKSIHEENSEPPQDLGIDVQKLPFKKKGWINKNCNVRGNQRNWLHLKHILQNEPTSTDPTIPTYGSIEASPSVFPQKKYCDVTGFVAPYTCPRTKLHYASAEVYSFIHNSLTDGEKDQYLSLRNAQVKIK